MNSQSQEVIRHDQHCRKESHTEEDIARDYGNLCPCRIELACDDGACCGGDDGCDRGLKPDASDTGKGVRVMCEPASGSAVVAGRWERMGETYMT